MRLRLVSCVGTILLVLLCSAAGARAEDFKTHYDLAMALYQAQRYEQAVAEFQSAYAADPKPGLLFNIAQSYRKSGHLREAIDYYDRYLAADPKIDEETRHKVDGYLAEARNTVAALELEMKRRMAEEKAAQEDRAVAVKEPSPPPLQQEAPLPALPPAAIKPAPPPPRPIYKKWWFWTAIGGVVVAGAVVGGVLGARAAAPDLSVLDGVPRGTVTF